MKNPLRLFADLVYFALGAASVLLALLFVFGFLLLHLAFRLVWWLFCLPARLMGAVWSRS